MAGRDDLSLRCLTIGKVPADVTEDILVTRVTKFAPETKVKKTSTIPGAEADEKLRRCIFLLSTSQDVQAVLNQVQHDELEVEGNVCTVEYERSIPCEIPETWVNEQDEDAETPDDLGPLEPLPRKPHPSDYSSHQSTSGPTSGFYENVPAEEQNTRGVPLNHSQMPGHLQMPYGQFPGQLLMPVEGEGHAHMPFPGFMPPYGQMPPGTTEGQNSGQGPMPAQGQGNVPMPGPGFMPGYGQEGQYMYPFQFMQQPEGGVHGTNQGPQGQFQQGRYPPQFYGFPPGYPGQIYPQKMPGNPYQNANHPSAPHDLPQGNMSPRDESQGHRTPPPTHDRNEFQGQGDESGKLSKSATPQNQSLSPAESLSRAHPHDRHTGSPQLSQPDQGANMKNLKKKIHDQAEGKADIDHNTLEENPTVQNKDTEDEHVSLDADDANITKILVSNLPSKALSEDYLEMFFEARQFKDCEVESIELNEEDSTAIVEFTTAEAVQTVLQKQPIKIRDTEVNVEIYNPKPVPLCTVEVRGPPNTIVEHMLELYFENKKKSGGEDIERIEVDEDGDGKVAFVTFQTEEVAQRVAEKSSHKIGKKEIFVTLHMPQKPKRQTSSESQGEESDYRREEEIDVTPEEQIPLDTITVHGPDEVLEEETLQLYFEHRKSLGGDVLRVEIGDNVAFIKFEDEEVARRVVEKGDHKINNKEIEVKLHIPVRTKTLSGPSLNDEDETDNREDDYDTPPEEPTEPQALNTIEVRDLPENITDETVIFYFENRRSGGGDIEHVEIKDGVAYVTFESGGVAQRVVDKNNHKINGHIILVEMHTPTVPEAVKPPRTVQVRGMRRVKSVDTVQYYFENKKRSGGGDIESFLIDEGDDDVVLITFEEPEAAEEVTKRSHSVEGTQLQVTLTKPSTPTRSKPCRKKGDEIPENPVKDICVKGLKKVKSHDTVQYYFENKRRSGGGDIVDIRFEEEDEDVAFITFQDADVAKAVADRSHNVDGVDLSVCLYTPPKPRPCYENRVLIEGVKTSTTKDCLFNFLEAKTGSVPETLVYGDKDGVLMVTFETNPDFEKLENVSKKVKLEGASLKITRVTISNCLIVTNIPENTSHDTLEFYFENHRRSGGGPVEKVVEQDDGSVLVYFNDHEVIDNVLKQPHTIDGQQIHVNLYLDRLGVTQGDGSEPKLQIPDHVVINGIELQKLKFILNSTVNKEAIERQIANCHAKIIWPEHPKSGNVTIECTLTADIKDCRKLAKTWKQSVEENFQDFMKNIVVSQMRVISDVWNKVMEGLQNMTIDAEHAVAVLVDKDEGAVTVVGLKHAIGKVSGDISKIIKDVEDEAERDKQRVKETVTSFELVITKMLLAAKYPTKMEDKYENLKVKINQNKNEILFEGLLSDVRGAKVDMYEMIQGFSHKTIDNIPETCAGLYQTKQVKEYIVKALKQNHVTAIWEVTGRQLVIYSISDDQIKRCSEIVQEAVVERTIGLNKNSRALINTELWQGKIDELHAQHTGRAYISVPQDLAKVHVCTTDDIALETMDAMKKFLRLNTICEESVQFTRSITKLIETHHKDELHQISKDLTSAHVQIIVGHQSAEFKVRGTEEGMKSAKIKLQALADRVIKRNKSFNKPGLGIHMQSTEGKDTINVVENALPCVIEIKGDGNDDEATEGLYDTIPGDSKPPSQGGSTIHASCKAYDDRKIYTAEGDMTELTVDVLVNTADEKLSLTGGLGKVIVSKGGEAISRACSDYIQRSGKLSEGETFLSPAGRLKSKFIIHVVGPVWKGGDNKEEDQLTEAVFRAMMQASRKNLKSIALPAISCGVYSFPVKRATTVIVAAVKNFFREEQESSLREVYLCDVKGNTVSAFTDALFGEFGRSAVTVYPQTRPVPSPRYKADTSASMPIRPSSTSDEDSDSDTGPYTKKKLPPGAIKVMPSMPPLRKGAGGGGGCTIGTIRVIVVNGEIAKQKVDVIVNTTAKNLDLKNGGVSSSLSREAGPQLQQEVTKNYPNGIKDGEVAITTGHNLKCKNIIHGAMMNWDGGAAATGALHDLMATSLKEAEKLSAASVAFPAIGTGNLGFPRDVVAKEMFKAVSKFAQSSPSTTIKEVQFIVFQKDFQTIKAFDAEKQLWVTGDRNTLKRQERKFEETPVYSSPNRHSKYQSGPDNSDGSGSEGENVYEDLSQDGCIFGNLKVTVKQGDITTELVDCIVNSTNENLDLTRGAVSKALLKKGGPALKKDAESKHGEMKKCGLAMTYAPGLVTKRIIHVVAKESVKDWKHIILKCLEKAENENMTSLAFPALGTGMQMQASEIAKAMISSIMDFQSSQPSCLKEVRIVIFQSQMVEEFNKAIEQASGAKPKGGFFETIQKGFQAAFGGPTVPPRRQAGQRKSYNRSVDKNEVTFTIYAMEENTIQSAISHLKSTLDKMVYSRDFKNTVISRLTDKQRKDVKKIAEHNHLQLKWGSKEDKEGLVISGIMKKVVDAQEEIYEIIRVADKLENEKREAEIMNNVVQWHFIEITELKQELMPYDPTLNLRIEKAYNNKDKCYEFNDKQGNCYVVDFTRMEEYTKGNKTDAVTVIRRDKIKEGTFEAPVTWTDMKGNLKVVTLQPTDKEFQDIAAKFAMSSGGNFTVSKIDRIQNKTLFQQYQAKKELLDSQNPPGHQNERFLWHGTAADSKDSINAHGFNRSYCGKNATAFGDGVYFAVQASYSCQQQYSRPDANGIKRMYYCRVLTGEFAVGAKGMRVPPSKPSGAKHALYDSVVNNVQNPGMYIIFHDTQGYPDYLLEFK